METKRKNFREQLQSRIQMVELTVKANELDSVRLSVEESGGPVLPCLFVGLCSFARLFCTFMCR
jgi:hypothetical protein